MNDRRVKRPYYSDEVRAEAKRLLNHKAACGNHGFTGEALIAWRTQRRLIREQLRKIARGERARVRDLEGAMNAPCPRLVSCRCGRDQRGTDDGFRWAFVSVIQFIPDIRSGTIH